MPDLPIQPEEKPSVWTFTGRTWFVIIICGFVLLGYILQLNDKTDDHVAECRAMYEETDAAGSELLADILDVEASDLGFLTKDQYVSKCVRLGWYENADDFTRTTDDYWADQP